MLGLASLVWLYIALQGKRTQAEQSLFNANLLQTRADNANRTGNLSVAQASLKTAERRLLDLAVQNRDAENRLFALQPELRWVTPPARLPDWNPASPYVWVRKEALGRINVPALQLNGDLTPEVCVMLDLTPEVKGLITVAAKSMIDQFGKKTVELSEVVPLPTNGIKLEANQQAVTVKVAPFEAYALSLKEEFETAVRETLDPQRAGLLLQWSYGTVDMLITRHVYETKYITLL